MTNTTLGSLLNTGKKALAIPATALAVAAATLAYDGATNKAEALPIVVLVSYNTTSNIDVTGDGIDDYQISIQLDTQNEPLDAFYFNGGTDNGLFLGFTNNVWSGNPDIDLFETYSKTQTGSNVGDLTTLNFVADGSKYNTLTNNGKIWGVNSNGQSNVFENILLPE